jgi:hypothetical protein
LSTEHSKLNSDLSDEKDAEQIELEVEQLITSYCEEKGYLVNGFPTEKRQVPEEDLEEDYFCRERYQLYLDTLATQKEDVAELKWCYVSNFWADQYESKEEYLQSLKDNLDSGVFYDVTI